MATTRKSIGKMLSGWAPPWVWLFYGLLALSLLFALPPTPIENQLRLVEGDVIGLRAIPGFRRGKIGYEVYLRGHPIPYHTRHDPCKTRLGCPQGLELHLKFFAAFDGDQPVIVRDGRILTYGLDANGIEITSLEKDLKKRTFEVFLLAAPCLILLACGVAVIRYRRSLRTAA